MTAAGGGTGPGRPVLVVGAGLMGASTGLSLVHAGVPVHLRDSDEQVASVASQLGAGTTAPLSDEPWLVVVAVPPDRTGEAVADALDEWPRSVVTDLASVKVKPLRDAGLRHPDLRRYVGSHPLAGSERSGPLAASAQLFAGRAWCVAVHDDADPAAVAEVEEVVRVCGATPVRLSPSEHDEVVARTSHLPHLLAVLTAARLLDDGGHHLELCGQGLRDVTRVAAGDPAMWRQIIRANAAALGRLLRAVRADIDGVLAELDPASPPGTYLDRLLERGVSGTRAIPGRHGGAAHAEATVHVVIADQPGALAGLLAEASQAQVNVEDLRIDHDPARPGGVVALTVSAEAAPGLAQALAARGWVVHR